jgi:hypothetical protein
VIDCAKRIGYSKAGFADPLRAIGRHSKEKTTEKMKKNSSSYSRQEKVLMTFLKFSEGKETE